MVAQKLIDPTKNGENVLSFEVAKAVLMQYNLVDNQYTKKVLCTFTPHKSYIYLLNVKPSNLVLVKIYNNEFDDIIITFTDQNS